MNTYEIEEFAESRAESDKSFVVSDEQFTIDHFTLCSPIARKLHQYPCRGFFLIVHSLCFYRDAS